MTRLTGILLVSMLWASSCGAEPMDPKTAVCKLLADTIANAERKYTEAAGSAGLAGVAFNPVLQWMQWNLDLAKNAGCDGVAFAAEILQTRLKDAGMSPSNEKP